jgi:hypothetical protein
VRTDLKDMYAEEVADKAMEFVRRAGYGFPRLEKVIYNEQADQWQVLVDVGVHEKYNKKVMIDDKLKKSHRI